MIYFTRTALIICCLFILACSKSDEVPGIPDPPEINYPDGYPKIFSDQVILEDKIDVYSYDAGELVLIRSFIPDRELTDRTITLNNQTQLSDTSHPVDIEYELVDGCIKDWRDYERKRMNEDSTLISISYLSVGVNGTTVGGVFDCNKTDSMVIDEAVSYYASTETFDSVFVDRIKVELSLQ